MTTARGECAALLLHLLIGCSGRVADDADALAPDGGLLSAQCDADAGASAACIEDHTYADACAAYFPDKPRRWACDRVPAGCPYLFTGCVNCIEFCCGLDAEPSAAEPHAVDAGPSLYPPAGCTRRPVDDWTCELQQKPVHAFRCNPNLPAADDSGIPRYPEGCLGNPYSGGAVCTFETDGECRYCAGYVRDICCE